LIRRYPNGFCIILAAFIFTAVTSLVVYFYEPDAYKKGIELDEFDIPYKAGLSLGTSIESSSYDRVTSTPFISTAETDI